MSASIMATTIVGSTLAGANPAARVAENGQAELGATGARISDTSDYIEGSARAATNIGIMPYPHGTRAGHMMRSQAPGESAESASANDEISAPLARDLVSDFLPFDRATLERAIDQFLEESGGLSGKLARLETSTSVLPVVTLVGMTVIASQVVIRQRRLRDERAGMSANDSEQCSGGLPRLPNSWSWGLDGT
jgi:hypothetical protein